MTIEPGLSPAGLRNVKSWFRDFALRASLDLEARYEGIKGHGFELLMSIHATTLGAAQLAFPPENVRELIDADRKLAQFRIEFVTFLSHSIDSLYRGTRHGAGRNK